jgi:hypothetical protein
MKQSAGSAVGTARTESERAMHYDSDEERLTGAERLAAHDQNAAAEAFRFIACDDGVGDEVRLSAAELLSSLDHVPV